MTLLLLGLPLALAQQGSFRLRPPETDALLATQVLTVPATNGITASELTLSARGRVVDDLSLQVDLRGLHGLGLEGTGLIAGRATASVRWHKGPRFLGGFEGGAKPNVGPTPVIWGSASTESMRGAHAVGFVEGLVPWGASAVLYRGAAGLNFAPEDPYGVGLSPLLELRVAGVLALSERFSIIPEVEARSFDAAPLTTRLLVGTTLAATRMDLGVGLPFRPWPQANRHVENPQLLLALTIAL